MNIAFKKINIEDVLFFDIETVHRSPKLEIESKEFDLFRYKNRNRETEELLSSEETIALYEKIGALKMGFNKIVTIGVGFVKNGTLRIKSICGEEEDILKEFFNICSKFKFVCGFNIIAFDLPICYFNASRYFDFTESIPDAFNTSGKKPWELKSVLDLMEIIRGTHFANISLEEALYHFDIPTSKDEIRGSEVSKTYYSEGIDKIKEYAKKDVFATINLFRKLQFSQVFESFEDADNKEVKIDYPLESMIYHNNNITKESQERIKELYKKVPLEDQEFFEDILINIYVRNEFGNNDSKEIAQAKIAEIKNILKNYTK